MHNREFKFGYQHFLLCQKSFLKVSSKWLLKNKSDNGKLLLGKTYSGERFRAILALLFNVINPFPNKPWFLNVGKNARGKNVIGKNVRSKNVIGKNVRGTDFPRVQMTSTRRGRKHRVKEEIHLLHVLTPSQTKNFGLLQTERVSRRQFQS